jgi:hypothetical protein
MIESKKMRWARHVSRTGEKRVYMVQVVKPEGKISLGYADVAGSIILKLNLENTWEDVD